MDSISAANNFLSQDPATLPSQSKGGPFRRNEEGRNNNGYRQIPSKAKANLKDDDGDLFDVSFAEAGKSAQRFVARPPSPPQSKVMTPAEFERYRKDKEREERVVNAHKAEDEKDEEEEVDTYEEEADDAEKSRALAKQRRKQEAHMTVYRQQMMKVTGESSGGLAPSSRPSMPTSFSSPNLLSTAASRPPAATNGQADSDDDEEVPLAILAAHGFPNKNRPPTRLTTVGSNPDLRAAVQMPTYQRPGSVIGPASAGAGGRNLPIFARNLPQDPYVGAGLVRNSVRESFALGGGAPAPVLPAASPGGLVGVIASEERSRALRRGSPDRS
ncbi:MAG: hypothetical protein OK454_11835, partial [Thaumarchaeota archaeon]|nr:hypothetical protein [Nitrososphaerota archaeon]